MFRGNPKVLGNDIDRHMRHQLCHQQRLVLGEIAVVKHEKELAALRKTLDRMRDAGRKEPDVAGLQVVDIDASFVIDHRHAAAPFEHVAPFSFLVPMHLLDHTGAEAHVHAGQALGDGQLPHRHFTGPSTEFEAIMRHPEGELQVRDGAIVGCRR